MIRNKGFEEVNEEVKLRRYNLKKNSVQYDIYSIFVCNIQYSIFNIRFRGIFVCGPLQSFVVNVCCNMIL